MIGTTRSDIIKDPYSLKETNTKRLADGKSVGLLSMIARPQSRGLLGTKPKVFIEDPQQSISKDSTSQNTKPIVRFEG